MSTINLAAITEALIEAACQNNDLHAAVSSLQEAAGIEDGGVADLIFDDEADEDGWPSLKPDERRYYIDQWIAMERGFLEKAAAENAKVNAP